MDIFELSLDELMNTPVQVAAKRDTYINQSPSSISTYTGQELASMGIKSLVQLLGIIPGFYSMYNPVEGNQSYIVTRGHSQKYASNILLLVNGQRLNDDYTGGISYFNRFMPLNFVQQVEIIRGPGSALYGSSAFNGVINIITQPQSNLTTSISSFDGYGASVAINKNISKIKMALGIQFHEDQGEKIDVEFDRFNLQEHTRDPRNQLHLDAQIKYGSLNWKTLYYTSNREDYYLFRRLRDGSTEINLSQLSTGFTWDTHLSESIKINAYTQYQQAHRDSLTALAVQDAIELPDADFLFGEDIDYESIRAGIDLQNQITSKHQWDNGLEWVSSQIPNGFIRSNYNLYGAEEYLGEVVTFDDDGQRVVEDKTREINSLYSQIESQWDHHIRTMLGVRYDHYNDTGSKWSPRLALVHNASSMSTWKFIYSEAYRVPSLGDLYDEESGLTIGNESLNPSTIQSTEISYSFLEKDMLLDIVLFSNNIHDLIGFRTQGSNTFLDNVTDTHSQGIEWQWTWIASSNIKIKHQATHILNISSRSEADDLTPIENLTPKDFGVSEVHYNFTQNIHSYIGLHWRSKVKVLQENNPLFTWHGHISYSLPYQQSLSLSVHNLTNESYSTGSAVQLGTLNNGNNYQEYPARGLEWAIQYHWKW